MPNKSPTTACEQACQPQTGADSSTSTTLDEYVSRYMDRGPIFSMFAKPGRQQALYDRLLKEKADRSLPYQVYKRETMPDRLHYSDNARIPDVLVLPEDGYVVFPNNVSNLIIGHHGYDNEANSMNVLLMATGPSFKRGVQLKGLKQVDIYGLMCRLLALQPLPHNGSDSLLPLMLSSAANVAASWCVMCAAAAAAAVAASSTGSSLW